MYLFKIFISGVILLSTITFSACQEVENDLVDASTIPTTTPTLILPLDRYQLTSINEVVNINVNVYDANNNPASSGKVSIVYPNDVKKGRDIGVFTDSTVEVNKGVANFVYTAPSSLVNNTSDIVFQFYFEDTPTDIKTFTFTIDSDSSKDDIVLTGYSLDSSLDDKNVTVDLNSYKLLRFFVRDDDGDLISGESIISMSITNKNTRLGYLEDSSGIASETIVSKDKKNNVTVNVNTNTISGIIPIEVKALFIDINGEEQTLSKVYNVIVLSGPPTAMSLSYASTEKSENAKFIEKWIVTLTDKYNNHVNTNPAVSMGMLAGYAKSSASTSNANNYLYYRTFEGDGTINPVNSTFTANSSAFANVDDANDYLVTFGNGYTYDVSGKWDISRDLTNNNILTLVDGYDGNTISNLGFAVGNNYRQDACRDAVEWVGNVYPEDGDYTVDSTGNMRINVEYDYYLTGKDVVLWVNLVGKKNTTAEVSRIGEAKKVTLRGKELVPEVIEFAVGQSGTIRLKLEIADTGVWLRNSNFGYNVDIVLDDVNDSKTLEWEVSDTSSAHGTSYCYGPANQTGVSYVEVNFTQPAYSSGTITLSGTVLGSEF